jgi:hypothetical protein
MAGFDPHVDCARIPARDNGESADRNWWLPAFAILEMSVSVIVALSLASQYEAVKNDYETSPT